MEEEEQCVLDTYEPASLHESDSDAENFRDVPVISCKFRAALEGLEFLHLFRPHNPHVNLKKGEQLEDLLYREKRGMESLQGMARWPQHQTAITGFFTLHSDIS